MPRLIDWLYLKLIISSHLQPGRFGRKDLETLKWLRVFQFSNPCFSYPDIHILKGRFTGTVHLATVR